MHKTKKTLMGLAALAALALGGSAIAGATGGGTTTTEKADGPDAPLTGAPAEKAGKAATDAVGGGGRVVAVENTDEGGPAVYEVKVADGGKVTEVQVSKDFAVTSKKADDDQGTDAQDKGDGDGEKADDGPGAHGQDKGDGDGDGPGAHGQDKGDGDGENPAE